MLQSCSQLNLFCNLICTNIDRQTDSLTLVLQNLYSNPALIYEMIHVPVTGNLISGLALSHMTAIDGAL